MCKTGTTFGNSALIIDNNLHVQIYLYVISLFSRETVWFIALEKVFVKQSLHNFIFKHGYRCAALQFKSKVVPNLKPCVRDKCLQETEIE